MKKSRISILILIFSLLVIFSSQAENYDGSMTLDYLEGGIQIKRGEVWVNIEMGEKLTVDTLLKLSADSIAEISGKGTSLTITKSGIYSLKDLLNKKKKIFASGLALAFKNLYKLLRGKGGRALSTAMGVRGAEVEDSSNGMEWVSEEDEYLNEAEDLIKKGDYTKAVSVLKENINLLEDPDIKQEYLYYLGYAYAMLGENARALSYLLKVKADESKPYFDDLILIKGQLLVDSLDFSGALKLFNYYLNKYPGGSNNQVIYFLSGICYRELNKNDKALISLSKAVKIDPASDIGIAADREMRVIQ